MVLNEGGLIRPGYHAELDELRDLGQNSKRLLAQIELRERERTGIASLKVRFNNVFGYYIEISKANMHLAPPDYERKQTLVNAERFTTPELKELEAKILDAEERSHTLERDLFAGIRRQVGSEASRIRQTAAVLAELDVLACFAHLAAEREYHRPEFSDDGELLIQEGRHPVIERIVEEGQTGKFIPNDLYMNGGTDLLLIVTGPNMGGKSTYLRQAAQIALMAQMGSFVPAGRAKLPIFDRIFTRIGASDNLARGRSTFMVEMTEAAAILNTATPRSLVLLDEVGRGTATFDGLAIAWAVVEYLLTHTRAKTLFATHYHELTELADLLPGVKNYHVSVKESGSNIIFLRKVEAGQRGQELWHRSGAPGGFAHHRHRARARNSDAARAERAQPERAPGDPQAGAGNGAGATHHLHPAQRRSGESHRERRPRQPEAHRSAQPAGRIEKADSVTSRGREIIRRKNVIQPQKELSQERCGGTGFGGTPGLHGLGFPTAQASENHGRESHGCEREHALEHGEDRDRQRLYRTRRGLLGSRSKGRDFGILRPLMLGEDPLNVEPLYTKMVLSTGGAGSLAGVTVTAISGVEIALWDLAGKILGVRCTRCGREVPRLGARVLDQPADGHPRPGFLPDVRIGDKKQPPRHNCC